MDLDRQGPEEQAQPSLSLSSPSLSSLNPSPRSAEGLLPCDLTTQVPCQEWQLLEVALDPMCLGDRHAFLWIAMWTQASCMCAD